MAALRIPANEPQLFLDDERIALKEGVARKWHKLKKHTSNPLIAPSMSETAIYLLGSALKESDPNDDGSA
ncbi:MAG: hypothetical protein QGH20_07910 [Candidatus Latescibacteria bacterium]|nr:hypothetical protein [Candidatus Latescibacterota bacterium]